MYNIYLNQWIKCQGVESEVDTFGNENTVVVMKQRLHSVNTYTDFLVSPSLFPAVKSTVLDCTSLPYSLKGSLLCL